MSIEHSIYINSSNHLAGRAVDYPKQAVYQVILSMAVSGACPVGMVLFVFRYFL